MFLQIFRDIWNNKISRFFLLLALTLILVGGILNAKMAIYTFFYRLFVGEVFFDPYTYRNNDYGFVEKPEKSEKLFLKGLKKLVKISADLYKIEKPDEITSSKYDPDLTWEKFASDKSTEMVYMLFHDLELFCVPFEAESSSESGQTENLKKRYSVRRNSSADPVQYAIKDDEYVKYANLVLDIDQDYFYLALQKKPDSVPALQMREKLLKAVCRPQNISVEMTRALEYKEYKTGKDVYAKYKGNNSDFIADETYKLLKQDKQYTRLLKQQFQNTYYMTKNISEKIKQSYGYYLLHNDTFYLENYLKSILELAQYSGINQNKKNYAQLISMKNEKIMANKSYLYTLAEVSFRAHDYEECRKYLDLLSMNQDLAGTDLYRIKRLYFMLELLNSG